MLDAKTAKRVQQVQQLATLLDGAWRIPFTRWRIGIDALLGLLPVAGDVIGAILGLVIVWHAHQLGAPWSLRLHMLWNLLLDLLLGLVPVVGDIADIAFRKNLRNAALLENWVKQHVGSTHGQTINGR